MYETCLKLKIKPSRRRVTCDDVLIVVFSIVDFRQVNIGWISHCKHRNISFCSFCFLNNELPCNFCLIIACSFVIITASNSLFFWCKWSDCILSDKLFQLFSYGIHLLDYKFWESLFLEALCNLWHVSQKFA